MQSSLVFSLPVCVWYWQGTIKNVVNYNSGSDMSVDVVATASTSKTAAMTMLLLKLHPIKEENNVLEWRCDRWRGPFILILNSIFLCLFSESSCLSLHTLFETTRFNALLLGHSFFLLIGCLSPTKGLNSSRMPQVYLIKDIRSLLAFWQGPPGPPGPRGPQGSGGASVSWYLFSLSSIRLQLQLAFLKITAC